MADIKIVYTLSKHSCLNMLSVGLIKRFSFTNHVSRFTICVDKQVGTGVPEVPSLDLQPGKNLVGGI